MKRPGGLLGVGSPIVDLLTAIPESVLRELPGAKGGTLHLTDEGVRELAARFSCRIAPGGAAANTVQAAARLGSRAAFLGKVGDDEYGRIFRADLRDAGVSEEALAVSREGATGLCLSLVTPDGERTMRSSLGVSAHLAAAELERVDFDSFEWVLIEGYMLEVVFFEELLHFVMHSGCRVAFDLSSFELAAQHREKWRSLLRTAADLLFANEEEAAALLGAALPPGETLARLNESVPLAVLKCGERGAFVGVRGKEPVRIGAHAAGAVVDTTAAGDYFAAGFLYGLLSGWSAEKAGRCGALLAGEIITVPGARLPEETWEKIRMQLKSL